MSANLASRRTRPRAGGFVIISALCALAVPATAIAQGESSSPALVEPAVAPPPSKPDPSSPPADKGNNDLDAAVAGIASGSSNEASDSESRVSIYGFSDFTYTRPLNNAALVSQYPSFAVGNLNVYLGTELGDGWRTLSEVRFTYLPDGAIANSSEATPSLIHQNTTVGDYTDLNRPVRWGGVIIQRVWIERMFHPLFTLRAGHFPSPYGIWNVDHGSPVIIGVRRPFIIGQELIPQTQTGLEAYGVRAVGDVVLGYHLTLSNGRGPVSTYQDLDKNKAIGGRLYVQSDLPIGTLTLGVSGYAGLYTARHDSFSTTTMGLQSIIDNQYRERSLTADLKWQYGGLLLQSEVMVNDIAYTEIGRPAAPTFGGPPGLAADLRRFGIYGLIGYRTPWFGIMPYFIAQTYDDYYNGHSIEGGLNIRSTPRVVLKAQVGRVWINGADGISDLVVQAAWSF